MIREETRFVTEDGEHFTNLQDAKLHQFYIKLVEEFTEEFGVYGHIEGAATEMVKWFFDKFGKEYK